MTQQQQNFLLSPHPAVAMASSPHTSMLSLSPRSFEVDHISSQKWIPELYNSFILLFPSHYIFFTSKILLVHPALAFHSEKHQLQRGLTSQVYFIFLTVLLSLKISIHWFSFSPISSVSLPTLSFSARLSLGPTHRFYAERWHVENWRKG